MVRKSKTLLLLFVSVYLFSTAHAQVSIKLTLKNSEFKQAYLCGIYGLKLNVVGAKKFKGDVLEFKYPSLTRGVYRILMTDSAYIDFIVDRDKEIEMETSYPRLSDSMKVTKGEDNKIYFGYVKYKKAQINKLAQMIRMIKPEQSKKQNPLADERCNFIKGVITYQVQQYSDSLYMRDSTLFVAKIIRALLPPNFNIWQVKHPTHSTYKNDIEFLMTHFFDNIDFSDSMMLHTDIFFRTINTYIEKLALPRNVLGFNIANDFILKKAMANKNVYNYTVSLLVDLYEKSQLEEVYEKLYDDIISKDTSIVSRERLAELKKKMKIIKSLKPGSTAPDIGGRDTTGRELNLSSVKSSFVLLILWTTYSKNAEETITELNDLYKKYKDNGLRIFAVSLDTSETQWKTSLRKLKPEWTNVIDTAGLNGQIPKLYNTWSLPGLYIMDKNRVIAAKPMNIDYIKSEFEKAFKK